MAKVLILIGMHLSTAPRPQKEALFLRKLGHDVQIRGVWFDEKFVEEDLELIEKYDFNFKPVLDFTNKHFIRKLHTRIIKKIADKSYQYFNRISPPLFGYGAKAFYREAKKCKADLTIAHSEATLWAIGELLDCGYNVGVDMEDWFSRDLPQDLWSTRPLSELEILEKKVLANGSYSITTSKIMSERISQDYLVDKPKIIYNTFLLEDRESIDGLQKDRKDLQKLSLHWFSHTVGTGRGLENLFKSLVDVAESLEVHIRGEFSSSTQEAFKPFLSKIKHHDIYFHERVPNDELLSRIAEHDIGLALEPNDVPSTNYTVSNKLFQYMLAGLGVIATKTLGQKEVMSSWCKERQLVPCENHAALASSIIYFQENKEELLEIKKFSVQKAVETYHFDSQERLLKQCVAEALSNG